MALAERFRAEFYSEQAELYRVSIWAEGYPGAVRTVEITAPVIDYEGSDTEIHNPVIPSSISFGVFIKNNPDATLAADIANSQEGDFIVEVLRDGLRYYTGIVLSDQLQVQDTSYPYIFVIRAKIGRAHV